MLETEFINSMNNNYERIHLKDKPEEKRYQYCILSRGGIRGLLPCSLRYINGDSYLYYDITSKQSVSQIYYNKKKIDREWIKDFVWNLDRIKKEAARFLLDDKNIIWFPENVYQDLEDNRWSFLYYPYYEGENGFRQFLEFVIEKLDHNDEGLISCVYGMYEQFAEYGDAYLHEKILTDVNALDAKWEESEISENRNDSFEKSDTEDFEKQVIADEAQERNSKAKGQTKEKKGGLFSFLEGAKKKDREIRTKAFEENKYEFDYQRIPMVAEKEEEYISSQKEEYGQTIYMENVAEKKDTKRRLYDESGSVVYVLEEEPTVIGKKKDEADVIIDNPSISRIHARISFEDGYYVLEDLNSTNGTFKNGMRLRPYERKKLLEGDEIRLGNVNITYK